MNSEVVEGVPVHRPVVSVGWFVKRMVLGLFILAVSFGSLAWLTYASIDPRVEAAQRSANDASLERTETGSISQRH